MTKNNKSRSLKYLVTSSLCVLLASTSAYGVVHERDRKVAALVVSRSPGKSSKELYQLVINHPELREKFTSPGKIKIALQEAVQNSPRSVALDQGVADPSRILDSSLTENDHLATPPRASSPLLVSGSRETLGSSLETFTSPLIAEEQATTGEILPMIVEEEEPNSLPAASPSATHHSAAHPFPHELPRLVAYPVPTNDPNVFHQINDGVIGHHRDPDIADPVGGTVRERRGTTTQAATASAATLTVSTPSQADSTVATSLATTTIAASRPAASAPVVTTIVAPTAATGSSSSRTASIGTTTAASRPAASAPVVTTTVAPTAATASRSSRTASTGEPTVAPRPTVLLPTAPVTTTIVSSAGATPASSAVVVTDDHLRENRSTDATVVEGPPSTSAPDPVRGEEAEERRSPTASPTAAQPLLHHDSNLIIPPVETVHLDVLNQNYRVNPNPVEEAARVERILLDRLDRRVTNPVLPLNQNYRVNPNPVEEAARVERILLDRRVTNPVLPTPLAPVLAPIVPVIGAPAVTTAGARPVTQEQITGRLLSLMQDPVAGDEGLWAEQLIEARARRLRDVPFWVNEMYRAMPLERNGRNEGRIMTAYYEIINGDNIGGAEDEQDNRQVARPDNRDEQEDDNDLGFIERMMRDDDQPDNRDEQDVEDEEADQNAPRERGRRAAAQPPAAAAAQPLAAGAGGGNGNGGAPDPDADAQAAADAAAQAQADAAAQAQAAAAAQAKLEAEAKELTHAQGVTKMQVSVGADANKTAQAPISNRFGEIITKALVAAGDEPDSLPKGVWISGVYGKSKQGTMTNNAGYNAVYYGPTIGADININDNNIVGVAYSYILSNYKFKDNLNRKLNAKSNVISLYRDCYQRYINIRKNIVYYIGKKKERFNGSTIISCRAKVF